VKQFQPSEEVDFLIIGAGAAGGVMAKELSSAGFSVVVLEQGPICARRISSTTKSSTRCFRP
jgi:choline dehydrogenase-like flavoprotein